MPGSVGGAAARPPSYPDQGDVQRTPMAILNLFFVIFWIIYIVGSSSVIKNTDFENRKHSLSFMVIIACVILILQLFFIVKDRVHLIALIPILALFATLIICTAKFCRSCGAMIYKYQDLFIKKKCPKCGQEFY